MAITLEELKEYIAQQVPEVDVLELLDISSEDLVETFGDYIEQNFDELIRLLELDNGEERWED